MHQLSITFFISFVLFLPSTQARSEHNNIEHLVAKQKVVIHSSIETIPFDYTTGLPIIDIMLGGKKRRFLFDTGAITVITPSLAKELNVQSYSKIPLHDANGSRANASMAIIPKLSLGNTHFHNALAVITPLASPHSLMACTDIDGIFGYNLMPLIRAWTLDYKDRTLTFGEHIHSLSANAFTARLTIKLGSGPTIPIEFGDNKILDAQIDTGKNQGFSHNTDILKLLIEDNRLGAKGRIIRHTSSEHTSLVKLKAPQISHFARIDNIALGNAPMQSIVMEFSNGPPLLGNKILEKFRLSIDWHTHVAYFEPRDDLDTNNADHWRTTGIIPISTNKGVYIENVISGDNIPAFDIQPGDKITAVMGKTLTSKNTCFYMNGDGPIWKQDTIDITVERDGKTRNVTLENRPVFRME